MSEVLIRAENVGKKFCRDLKKSLWYGVKDSAADLFRWKSRAASSEQREPSSLATCNSQLATRSDSQLATSELRSDEFWANKDISFELKRGECLGLIGRNGAGKTTLLKMLNGLIKPDCGSIEMRGSVGALIALGAGFNPLLTGRENVYVNGSILGRSRKEVDRVFEEIVEFAEISEFIDAPVRTYSSGMQARLGFAAASYFDCDILLIDEVLAVGDFAFRQKCFNRLGNFIDGGGSAVLVSHALEQIIARTDRVLFMEKGKLVFDGLPREALQIYENRVILESFGNANENSWSASGDQIIPGSAVGVKRAWFERASGDEGAVTTGSAVTFTLVLDVRRPVPECRIALSVFTQHEVVVVQSQYTLALREPGEVVVSCRLDSLPLRPSGYPVQVRIHDEHNACVDLIRKEQFLLRVMQPEVEHYIAPTKAILDIGSSWEMHPRAVS